MFVRLFIPFSTPPFADSAQFAAASCGFEPGISTPRNAFVPTALVVREMEHGASVSSVGFELGTSVLAVGVLATRLISSVIISLFTFPESVYIENGWGHAQPSRHLTRNYFFMILSPDHPRVEIGHICAATCSTRSLRRVIKLAARLRESRGALVLGTVRSSVRSRYMRTDSEMVSFATRCASAVSPPEASPPHALRSALSAQP